ncbi:APC family permease [Vibrio splendidus]|uniref:APC family permease n=1 Tax=Vibrio splendidus TaxID=29497 RepID=UPI000C855C30|nr:APC family permease [Vibrio splendidus]PMN83486.1 hypothetical protein BCT24_11655 [Vibrio splendidus]
MNLNFVKLLVVFLAVVFSTIFFGFATGEIIPYTSPAFSGWGALLAAIGAIGSFFLLAYQHFTVKDSTRFINIIKSNTFIILMAFTGLLFLSIAFNISNTLILVPTPSPSDVSANAIELGDLATWVAAFGTVSTLGFAIRQNHQLSEEQRKEKKERKVEEAKQRKELNIERNKREEHERKQQEMWASQAKMLTFQKYQNHKQLMTDLLKELEHEHSVTINEKSTFYKKLFPNNNSEHCDVKVEVVSSTYDKSSIALMDSLYNDLAEYIQNFRLMKLEPIATLESDITGKVYDDYLVKLFQFATSLHVELSLNEVEGSIYPLDNPSIRFSNIFIASTTFETLESIYMNISHFCGNEVIPSNNDHSIGYSLAKLHHFFTPEHHHFFSTDKGSLTDELSILWEYFLLLSHESLEQSAKIDREIILDFFDDVENYGLTNESPAHLPSILKLLLDSCSQIKCNLSVDLLNKKCTKVLANLTH